MKRYFLSFLLVLGSLGIYAQIPNGSVLIQNGTVLTITQGTRKNTDVLILEGKIAKIGTDLKAPKGVKVIDAEGLFVMPGIIDAHSHIAIDAVNEMTSPVTAEVWTGDALNPFHISIYRALAGGVTISHAMHGSANAIGGQNETIKHRYGVTDPELLRMKNATRTIKFALGENPTRVHGKYHNVPPKSRMGVEAVIRNAFEEALAYQKKWKEYKQQGGNGIAPEYNLRLQTLVDILNGEVMIHCHSYRADEILMLMQVCEDYGIKKICFQHVNEGFKIAPELAKFGAYASVFSDWWAYKFEVYYSTAYNAAILTNNGVTTSINSDSDELIRHLYHEAAKTQKYGELSDEQALAMITINPAKQLGIDQRVGSIEVGKDGDIAIFKNHPLSIYAIPQMTLVDGILHFDIHNDPDDMRVYVNPEEDIDTANFDDHGHDHKCLQGLELFLGEK
ncbi:amidohydrolase family protein [Rapidithrix thailandica]|uniref:Amidohydrolase family protein n=1 Tax=Rapidithrix thailandica TaxID=413964 RepID=A0AAW9S3P5_9BACT